MSGLYQAHVQSICHSSGKLQRSPQHLGYKLKKIRLTIFKMGSKMYFQYCFPQVHMCRTPRNGTSTLDVVLFRETLPSLPEIGSHTSRQDHPPVYTTIALSNPAKVDTTPLSSNENIAVKEKVAHNYKKRVRTTVTSLRNTEFWLELKAASRELAKAVVQPWPGFKNHVQDNFARPDGSLGPDGWGADKAARKWRDSCKKTFMDCQIKKLNVVKKFSKNVIGMYKFWTSLRYPDRLQSFGIVCSPILMFLS